jgi:hypothetical protein
MLHVFAEDLPSSVQSTYGSRQTLSHIIDGGVGTSIAYHASAGGVVRCWREELASLQY